MLATHIPRLISAVLSIVQASNLRNRVYAMEDRLDILEVAIEDIKRINSNAADPNALITSICANVDSHKSSIGSHYK